MTTARLIETAVVLTLFLGYLAMWRVKQARDIARNGVDPEVLTRASSPVQRYFARLVWAMTVFVVAIIGLHALAPPSWPPLARAGLLDCWLFDVLGGAVGLAGLGMCALAQTTMGASWRVGIDEHQRTELVTGGIYRWIRNPTYLGLHAVSLGLWLIWPTTLVAVYGGLFFLVMDIQVRCEEEHLIALHRDAYLAYAARTWRYLPWVY